jgi:RNA polymerase sigma factor (sigma-70 family)
MDELPQLVTRVKDGDTVAYDRIVCRFQDMAVSYGYSVLGDRHLAEDAAQEAFVEAFYCLGALYNPGAFPAWLRRIVFKHCDRVMRRKKSIALSPDAITDAVDHAQSCHNTPHAIVEKNEFAGQVRAAIASLPEHERVVVVLFYMGDHSQQKIAEFLEVPISTIKTRLFTARKKLKEKVLPMLTETLEEQRPSTTPEFAATIKKMLNQYWKQYKADAAAADAAAADKSLLRTARRLINARIGEGPVEREVMEDAFWINDALGEHADTLALLQEYRKQKLPFEDEAWARSGIIGVLAQLGRTVELVQQHRELIDWARENVPTERLLEVLLNTTGPAYWVELGRGKEWIQAYTEAAEQMAPTAESRKDRLNYYRQASVYYRLAGRAEESLQVIKRIRELVKEDPEDESSFALHIECYLLEIRTYEVGQDITEARRIAAIATAELEEYAARHSIDAPGVSAAEIRTGLLCLHTQYHNLGPRCTSPISMILPFPHCAGPLSYTSEPLLSAEATCALICGWQPRSG